MVARLPRCRYRKGLRNTRPVWGVAHIFFLIGFRNKITVTLHWMWQYLTFQGGMRLITGSIPASPQTLTPSDEAERSSSR